MPPQPLQRAHQTFLNLAQSRHFTGSKSSSDNGCLNLAPALKARNGPSVPFAPKCSTFARCFSYRRFTLRHEGHPARSLRPARISRPTLFALAFAPFYRRLEFFKLLTGHGLPYFLITER